MAPQVALLLLFPLLAAGLSWPKIKGQRAVPAAQNSFEANTFEVDAIQSNYGLLQSRINGPDCFKDVARALETNCADYSMGSELGVRAAIGMTICELATAEEQAPLECRSVPLKESDCVRAIKNIPQAWTSYSGYLREIPQLCFAFRRWNDIDSARDIYRNATLEVTSFLHMMSSKEAAEKQARNAWEVRISEMETMVSSVNAALNAMSTLTMQFTPWAENELTNIFTKFENRISEETFLADRMSVDLYPIEDLVSRVVTQEVLKAEIHIKEALDLAIFHQGSLIAQMTQKFQVLNEQMSGALTDSASLAQHMQAQQLEALSTTLTLQEVLKTLTISSHESIQHINESVSSIVNDLQPGSRLSDFIDLAERISNLNAFSTPLLGAVSGAIGCIFYLLRLVFDLGRKVVTSAVGPLMCARLGSKRKAARKQSTLDHFWK
ncbi:hypothetical protein R3P38DRAFT_3368454 [Favolaschia claudopus]|uniref:Karyogamy protein 5 n=1 Tax=Favolaschia claudopus TaxID=2862362 RepID=A0AAW0A4S2_9AGAR